MSGRPADAPRVPTVDVKQPRSEALGYPPSHPAEKSLPGPEIPESVTGVGCPDCAAAQSDPDYPGYRHGCRGCLVRTLAAIPVIVRMQLMSQCTDDALADAVDAEIDRIARMRMQPAPTTGTTGDSDRRSGSPAAPPRSQRRKEAGFAPRDTRLTCDECGKKFTRQMLPIHRCQTDAP